MAPIDTSSSANVLTEVNTFRVQKENSVSKLGRKRKFLGSQSDFDPSDDEDQRGQDEENIEHASVERRPSKLKRSKLGSKFTLKVSKEAMSSYHHGHHSHHGGHHHHSQHSGGSSSGSSSNGGMSNGSLLVDMAPSKFSSSVNSVVSNSSTSSKTPSIASLCNLGNTCFLNSVLYTLRFTPGFLHNLHHMVNDLNQQVHANNGSANGSSKKLRNGLTNGFSNGHSSSELDSDAEMSHEVIEQLHDLFKTLSCADDTSDSREPIPPSSFLTAVGKLNPMFEGNQQQDAHELLVMILNILNDTKISVTTPPQANESLNGGVSSNGHDLPTAVPEKKGKKKGSKLLNGNHSSSNGKLPPKSPLQQATPSSLASPSSPKLLPNFVKDNFEGKSVMCTRCLECEMSTFRSEAFTNIDVPLHLDEEDEDLSARELFLKQIMMSETLRENNKYWCEECSRLNEARRSVQFEILPRVMVLQLKRFTAATGAKSSSYVSKINDYIPTPFTLNCFCTQCMPNTAYNYRPSSANVKHEPKHHYRLYAVIMHLGASLASGHYIAYVRASAETALWDYGQCQRGGTVERNKNKKGIMKFLTRNKDSKYVDAVDSASNGSSSGVSGASCRSSNCCGIKGGVVSSSSASDHGSSTSLYHQRSLDSADSAEMLSGSASVTPGESPGERGMQEDVWLECDDETIQIITRKQFEDVLGAKQGATTPYLLFYQKF